MNKKHVLKRTISREAYEAQHEYNNESNENSYERR